MNNRGNKGNSPKQQNAGLQAATTQTLEQAKTEIVSEQQNIKLDITVNQNKISDNVVQIAPASIDAKQSSENIDQTVNITSRLMNETSSISKSYVEACTEAREIANEHAKNISESIYESANHVISENVECFKNLFNCRTAKDLFSLQNRVSQINMKMLFDNHSKISNMLFEMSAKSTEPFTDTISDCNDRIAKLFK